MNRRFSNFYSDVFKNWVRYFIYALIIFVYIAFYTLISKNAYIMAEQTGSNFSFSLIQLIGNVIFGILLSFEHILNENKKQGLWVFNVPRFVFLGIPSLLFSFCVFIYYSNVPALINITNQFPDFMLSSWFYILNQILLGFILVTNFSKPNSKI